MLGTSNGACHDSINCVSTGRSGLYNAWKPGHLKYIPYHILSCTLGLNLIIRIMKVLAAILLLGLVIASVVCEPEEPEVETERKVGFPFHFP